jgi:hypothetical protein
MERRGDTGIRIAAMLVTALGAAIGCAVLVQGSFLARHNTTRQLQELPANAAVRLVGVVIYADDTGGHFWIQDQTGAVPLTLGSARRGVHVGETVVVEARKAARAGLIEAPSRADLQHKQTGAPEATGSASESAGRAQLFVPDAAPEVELMVTRFERDYSHWIDVLLLGVMSVLLWLFVLLRRIRLQKAALSEVSSKATKTKNAISDLSTEVQRVTKEGAFSEEVQARGEGEVAVLAEGFNALLAELQRMDRARREAEARLQQMALADELTGLPNRRLLSDRLSQSLARARRDQGMWRCYASTWTASSWSTTRTATAREMRC